METMNDLDFVPFLIWLALPFALPLLFLGMVAAIVYFTVKAGDRKPGQAAPKEEPKKEGRRKCA